MNGGNILDTRDMHREFREGRRRYPVTLEWYDAVLKGV